MAKRNSRGQFVRGGSRSRSSGSTKIVRVGGAAPIIRVSAPRAATKKRRRSGGGRRRGSSVGGFLNSPRGSRTALAVGALALGYASKEGWLAKLPVVGKAGPITSFGLIGFGAEEFAKVKLPSIVHDAVTCALVLSAFNIGFSGGNTIVGEEAYQLPGGAVFFD